MRLKTKLVISIVTALIILAGAIYFFTRKTTPPIDNAIKNETVKAGSHELQVYRATKPEKGLLIYIADKSQSNLTAEYAKQFAALSYYVAVVDNEALLNSQPNVGSCLNLPKKLADIKTSLQQYYNLDDNEHPILLGANQSSSTVYATLAQTKDHEFHAAIGINLETKLKAHAELCEKDNFSGAENQDMALKPIDRLPTSFYVFQAKDSFPETKQFSENISNLKFTLADGQKQTAMAEAIQILQWLDPRLADQISSDASDSDLPLIEVPASNSTNTQFTSESLVVLLTGDGGWAEIDKSVAKILAEKGVPTVALDSLSYFWKTRTPDETAKDIEETIVNYLKKWNKKRVILIGYSFGADVMPFIANRLTEETRQKIAVVALLGMGKTAAFEFRLSSWMNADTHDSRLPIAPEIAKMNWANAICIYGVDDDAANCLPNVELGVKAISMPGDHHFDERYEELVNHILANEQKAK